MAVIIWNDKLRVKPENFNKRLEEMLRDHWSVPGGKKIVRDKNGHAIRINVVNNKQ